MTTCFPRYTHTKKCWERMKELVKQGDNNKELRILLNEHYEERIMMVGEAFSMRDQMLCN